MPREYSRRCSRGNNLSESDAARASSLDHGVDVPGLARVDSDFSQVFQRDLQHAHADPDFFRRHSSKRPGVCVKRRTQSRLLKKTVVPGHGDVGGTAILASVRDYIADVRERVAEKLARGVRSEDLVEQLRPAILATHPDWRFPEGIDFAIRYFADTLRPAS